MLIATNSEGIYKSTDGGDSFVNKRNGFTSLYTNTVVLSPDFPVSGVAFAGIGESSNGGIYQSTDGGENWQPVNDGLGSDYIYKLAASPDFNLDGYLLAGTAAGAYLVSDTQAPTSTIITPTGSETITTSSLLISGSAQDNWALAQVDLAIQRQSDGYYWSSINSTWSPAAVWNETSITAGRDTTSAAWQYNWDNLPTDNGGLYTIQARAKDGAGNIEAVPAGVTVAIGSISLMPVSLNINNGAAYTNSTTITLEINATGATNMHFAESTAALSGQSWQPYATDSTFTLSAGDGQKTVYAQYKDALGNETIPDVINTSHSIILDTTAPQIMTVSPLNNAINVLQNTTISVSFSEANGIDTSTINNESFYLTGSNNTTVATSVVYNMADKRAILTPQHSLSLSTYTAHLTNAIKDIVGNEFHSYSWSFSVGDQTPPDTTISDPTTGTLNGSTKLITGSATDNLDISDVTVLIQRQRDSLYWNGTSWVSAPVWNTATITSGLHTAGAAWQYSWNLPVDNGGAYIIQASATDASLNNDLTPANVEVAIDNIGTQVSGDITSNSTWTKAASPYIVTNDVIVNSGSMLTIEPGVVVKFKPQTSLIINGNLAAAGSANDNITFTSIKDDTVAGDTNMDGTATVPAAGDWKHIYFSGYSTNSVLDYITVRYGGSGGIAMLNVGSPVGAITNAHISKSAGDGINLSQVPSTFRVTDSTITSNYGNGINGNASGDILRNVVSNNGSNGIALNASSIKGNTITGNSAAGILLKAAKTTMVTDNNISGNYIAMRVEYGDAPNIYANNINNNTLNGVGVIGRLYVWQSDTPFIIENDLTLGGSNSWGNTQTATFKPGVIVKFMPGKTLDSNFKIKVEGTAMKNVVFTSIKDDIGGDTNNDGSVSSPAPGDWKHLILRQYPATPHDLQYAVIRYGGGGAYVGGDMLSIQGNATIANSIIAYSLTTGIYRPGGSYVLTLTDSTISNNVRGMETGSADKILHNNFTANSQEGFYLDSPVSSSISGNTFTNNANAIKGIITFAGIKGNMFSGQTTYDIDNIGSVSADFPGNYSGNIRIPIST